MKLPRPVVLLVSALAGCVLISVVFGIFLLPRLIDSRFIREKIASEVVKKISGSVTFGKVAILWLPRPSVVIEKTEFSFDDKTNGSIGTARIYPSILYLLTGRLVVRRALLEQPKIRISLPAALEKPLDLATLKKQIHSVLVRLTTDLTAPRIDVSDGSAEIRIADKSAVILENVAVQTIASPGELRFELSGRSSLWDRLRVEGKISPEDLASQLTIGVQRLKINETLALLPLPMFELAGQSEASVDAKIAAVGLRQVKAAVSGSAGPVVFVRHGGTATLEIKRLNATITYEGGAFQIDVEQLNLASPQLKASGQLKILSDSLSTSIKARDVDIAEVGEFAVRMVDRAEDVKKILRYIPGGTITEMRIQTAGQSLADMRSSRHLVVSGLLRDCRVFIPAPELELTNVAGSVRFADGDLEAKDITANLGTMKAWNGMLRLGFEGKTSPFHLDISVHTGAAELQSVLLKLVGDEAVRAELLKLQNVGGDLSGRLTLGERIDAISPSVAISKTDIRAIYAPVPFPIAIREGRLTYDQKIFSLENAQGSVGRSIFAGLGMTLHHDGSGQIKIDSKRVLLDLQQTDALLHSFKDVRSHLEKLQSMRGQIDLQNLTLSGSYDDPAGWSFASTGTVDQIEIRHAEFPDSITVSRGQFEATQRQIKFSDTATAMSDGSFIGSGMFEYKNGAPIQFEVSGTGTIGQQMTERLSRYIELPEEIKFRAPLKIAAERFAWQAGGDISFLGQAIVAGDALLNLDAVKRPDTIVVRNLTIDDGSQRARMTFQLAKDNLDLSFSGDLTQLTIDKIFASFPTQGSSLQGDIQVSMARRDPVKLSARGRLSGSNLFVPFGTDEALFEKFNIEANGESLLVRSADVRWGKSQFTGSGKITGAKETLLIDLDVTSEQLAWEELQHLFAHEGKQRQQKTRGIISIPDIQGTIHLKTDRFTFERFNFSSLETAMAVSPSGISADIVHAVACGITVGGRMDVVGKEIAVDLQFAASEAQLEPATVCLTNRQNDVKGIYSLRARLAGRGDLDHLLESLKGSFELSAHNGEFIRSPGIDATFDYLNATGDFKVAFPDLDRETFPYRFVGIKGRIEDKILFGDEVSVESSLLNLSGQGKIDLERKQVDAKGLIAVLKPVDQVIARMPVISSIVGGSLIGIPVRISGSLERPNVTYLAPADVGVELLNIPLRILKMPLGAMRLFSPSGELRDKDISN